ncbi:hypothetical protein EDB85DRAFT_2015231, partial [Lactarius pseudohatsudake]
MTTTLHSIQSLLTTSVSALQDVSCCLPCVLIPLTVPDLYSPSIILIPGQLALCDAGYVAAHHSKSHCHQSWRLSFDPCCYPHLEARHFLTSVKH